MSNSQTILIAYDGSEDARHAIRVAAGLFPGARAEIVHAFEPLTSAAARAAVYAVVVAADADAMLAGETEAANETAQKGVKIAQAAGLDATGIAIGGSGPLWATIAGHVDAVHPKLVVMGTRGLTGVRSALVGSVSHNVAAHAKVPVLIVPHDAPVV
jgi:nucleotide-binding universal stress UspA family protein